MDGYIERALGIEDTRLGLRNVGYGFAGPVGRVRPRTAIAAIGLPATSELIIPRLAKKDVVIPVPDEDVIPSASQDDVSPPCTTQPVVTSPTEDAVISPLGVHIIVPRRAEDEIVGVCTIAGANIDEIYSITDGWLEIVRRDGAGVVIYIRKRDCV